jgi:uncharacterized membrane protein YdcZ (DUF606 family)
MTGWFSQAFIFGVILFIAGASIPLMAALNAGLGVRLGNPIPAVFVLFLVALRLQHISNGGLNDANPGMDMLGLNFAFDFTG